MESNPFACFAYEMTNTSNSTPFRYAPAKSAGSSRPMGAKPKPMPKRAYISAKTKSAVVARQRGACANTPGSKSILTLEFDDIGANVYYDCPLWARAPKGKNAGAFDAAQYQIDHVREVSAARDEEDRERINSIDNLQALCHSCHAIKTSVYKRLKKCFSGDDVVRGAAPMCVD